jgi:hypothetical protein
MFILYCWLRLGLHKLKEALDLVENSKPYGGVFQLSDPPRGHFDLPSEVPSADHSSSSRLLTARSRVRPKAH